MATRTIARLYDNYDDAVQVVHDLEAAGVPHSDVSLVASNHDNRYSGTTTDTTTGVSRDTADTASTGAGTGATVGTVLGGGAGLLAGIGALAIPGIGPLVAAGWLVAALTGAGVGAAAGGLLGSLTGAGVSEADAHVYAEGVRRGGTLVTVRSDDAMAGRVEEIMNTRAYVDPATRRRDYEASGWNTFDAAAPAYSSADVEAERARIDRERARIQNG